MKNRKFHFFRRILLSLLCLFVIGIFLSCFTSLLRIVRPENDHIYGFYNEDLPDVVYIGSSAVFVYFQPLRAWERFGFTSYNYSNDSMLAESVLPAVKEVLGRGKPELLVIDARPFEYYERDETLDAGFRNFSDTLPPFSLNRWKTVFTFLNLRGLWHEPNALTYLFDIGMYHSNIGNFAEPKAWQRIIGNVRAPNKGWKWEDQYVPLTEPADFVTEERSPIPEHSAQLLTEVLDYLNEQGQKAVFVSSPYRVRIGENRRYNTIQDMVEDSGQAFINFNTPEAYKAMELDFHVDFYNRNHVNLFGAAKYTDVLGAILKERYALPDHRGDPTFSEWDLEAERFREEESLHLDRVRSLYDTETEAFQARKRALTEAITPESWRDSAMASGVTLILASGSAPKITTENRWFLEKWWINAKTVPVVLRVFESGELSFSNWDDALWTNDQRDIGSDRTGFLSCESDLTGGKAELRFGGKTYSCGTGELLAVAVDSLHLEVLDDAVFDLGPDGSLRMKKGSN